MILLFQTNLYNYYVLRNFFRFTFFFLTKRGAVYARLHPFFAVSAPKNSVLFLLFFLKKSCHCGTLFWHCNFVIFSHCIDVFSVGWSTLEDPRPPDLIMKTFCIHFHFRRCSALNAKKDVVIWERVLRLFLLSLQFNYP